MSLLQSQIIDFIAVICLTLRACLSDITSYYFVCLSKVRSMLHHKAVGRVQNKIKNVIICFQIYFGNFFVFHHKICVFIIMYALNTAHFYEDEMSVNCLVVEDLSQVC